MKDELDKLATKHKNFKVVYVLSRPQSTSGAIVGHIDLNLVREMMPAPGPDTLIYVCGPPGFVKVRLSLFRIVFFFFLFLIHCCHSRRYRVKKAKIIRKVLWKVI